MDCNNCEIFSIKCGILLKFAVNSKSEVFGTCTIENRTSYPQLMKIYSPLTDNFYLTPAIHQAFLRPKGFHKVGVSMKYNRELRTYFDCVTIECSYGCTGEIHIEAVPTIREFNMLPKEIKLGHVFLGEICKRKIVLHPKEKEMPFLFMVLKPNPDLKINPAKGVVYKEPVEILITYAPMEYITLVAPVNVYLPTVIQVPFTLTITANTKPGFFRDKIKERQALDVEVARTMDLRQPAALVNLSPKKTVKPQPTFNQHVANLYLMKEKALDDFQQVLKGPLGRSLENESVIQQKKQNEFFEKVHDTARENHLAYFHEKTKLRNIEADWFERENFRGKYLNEKNRKNVDLSHGPQYHRQRVLKYMSSRETYTFSGYKRNNNEWFVRHQALKKFIEAARKIVIKMRMEHKLQLLKKLTKNQIRFLESVGEFEFHRDSWKSSIFRPSKSVSRSRLIHM